MKFTEFRAVPNAAAAHQGPLTVSSSAVTLLSLLSGGALHAETRFVEITVEDESAALFSAPTSALGRLLLVDSSRLLSRAEADLAKVIRVTTDAALQVTQYTN